MPGVTVHTKYSFVALAVDTCYFAVYNSLLLPGFAELSPRVKFFRFYAVILFFVHRIGDLTFEFKSQHFLCKLNLGISLNNPLAI